MLRTLPRRTLDGLQAVLGAATGRTAPLTLIPSRWGGAGPWLFVGQIRDRRQLGGHRIRAKLETSPVHGVHLNVAAVGWGSWLFGWMPNHSRCGRILRADWSPTGERAHVGPHQLLPAKLWGHEVPRPLQEPGS